MDQTQNETLQDNEDQNQLQSDAADNLGDDEKSEIDWVTVLKQLLESDFQITAPDSETQVLEYLQQIIDAAAEKAPTIIEAIQQAAQGQDIKDIIVNAGKSALGITFVEDVFKLYGLYEDNKQLVGDFMQLAKDLATTGKIEQWWANVKFNLADAAEDQVVTLDEISGVVVNSVYSLFSAVSSVDSAGQAAIDLAAIVLGCAPNLPDVTGALLKSILTSVAERAFEVSEKTTTSTGAFEFLVTLITTIIPQESWLEIVSAVVYAAPALEAVLGGGGLTVASALGALVSEIGMLPGMGNLTGNKNPLITGPSNLPTNVSCVIDSQGVPFYVIQAGGVAFYMAVSPFNSTGTVFRYQITSYAGIGSKTTVKTVLKPLVDELNKVIPGLKALIGGAKMLARSTKGAENAKALIRSIANEENRVVQTIVSAIQTVAVEAVVKLITAAVASVFRALMYGVADGVGKLWDRFKQSVRDSLSNKNPEDKNERPSTEPSDHDVPGSSDTLPDGMLSNLLQQEGEGSTLFGKKRTDQEGLKSREPAVLPWGDPWGSDGALGALYHPSRGLSSLDRDIDQY